MDRAPIRVLLVEDNATDMALISGYLREAEGVGVELQHVERLSDGLDCLAMAPVDVVLLDLGLPDSQGIDSLRSVREQAPHAPVVVLTGSDEMETALEAIREGAADYLFKAEFDRPVLVRAIRYACERSKAERALRERERRYRQLLSAVKSYTYSVALGGQDGHNVVSTEHGPGCVATTGYTPEDYAVDPYLWFHMVHPDDRDGVQRQVAKLLAGEPVPPLEHRIRHRDGTTRWVRDTVVPHYDEGGRLVHYDGVIEDITERRRAEEALRESEVRLLAARRVQESLLPRVAPKLPGYDVAGTSVPCEMIGGDYFDFIPMAEQCVGIAVGDSSGHGLASALLTAELRAILRSLILTNGKDVGEVVSLANDILSQGIPEGDFTTLVFARLAPSTGTLTYSSAGHPPPCILDAAGHVRGKQPSMGLPLGIQEGRIYGSSTAIPLKRGDTVLMFSDGAFEAASADGGLFGIERLWETVRERRHLPAREIVSDLQDRIAAHCRPSPLSDDVTTVVVKVEADER
jgi:PAS domain S-box-containing protein